MILTIGGHFHNIFSLQDLINDVKFMHNIGGNAIQIFVGNQSKTTLKYKAHFSEEDFATARQLMKKYKMTCIIHCNLSMNLANDGHSSRYSWMIDNILYDLNFAKNLNAFGCVIHTGFRKSDQTEVYAIKIMANNIDMILAKSPNKSVKLLIETSAGQTNRIASSIEGLKQLYANIDKKYYSQIGFCIDSSHIFTAGYSINTLDGIKDFFAKWDKLIGLNKVYVVHLNDSKNPLGSGVNRHENLLEGEIFDITTLKYFLSFIRDKIIILETRDQNKYLVEINLLKAENKK